jgi:sugar lactone lactonase YvrE
MQSKTARRVGRVSRCVLAAAVLCVALGACAASSLAAPYGRSFVTQISNFEAPEAVTVTGDDHVLVSDVGDGKVTELEPYPSLAPVDTESGAGYWGGSTMVHSVAKSAANDFLYIGTDGPELPGGGSCGGTPFVVLDNFGQVVETFKPFSCEMWSAVDNAPQSDSFGRNYIYVAGKIEAFDGYGSPVNFSGSASYIANNKISGTPFGSLSSGGNNPGMAGITVDSEGNIWVINQENREIDEFANTGVFIQRITEKSSGVPQFSNPAGPHGFAAYPGLTGIAVDPTNGDVLVSDKTSGVVDEFTPQGAYAGSLDGSGTPVGKFKFQCENPYGSEFCHTHVTGVAVNSQGYVYIADGLNGVVYVYGPRPKQPTITDKPDTNPTTTGGRVNALLDLNGGGNITGCTFEYGAKVNEYKLGTLPCSPDPSGGNFTGPTEVHVDLSGLTSETTYHYRWTAENANAVRVGPDRTFTPHKVLGLRADPADAVTSSSATLHGSFVGNAASTHYWFEYGTTTAYGTKAPLPAPPGGNAGSPAGPGRTSEELSIAGLKPVTRYHYRIVAENGSTSKSEDQSFRTLPQLPQAKEFVTDVHSNQVVLNASINPGGADTVYTFEYGTEDCSEIPDPCTTAFPDTHIGSNLEFHLGSKELEGLQAATTYHYRVLATNSVGTKPGPDRTFSTYQFSSELADSCPNALARQQTGAALASDCRAYELVSSAHAGGYDVESNLVPGQTPFDGYPNAESPLRVLYGIHNGAIPGVAGNPTNRGVDPYIATRGSEGWTTSYVGIPANDPFATSPFSSTLAGADAGLTSFAFAGAEICSPCFEDGSTGVPVHLPDGSLVNGMAGSIEPPTPATSDGLVKKHFSADGSHFVFSTTTELQGGGNDSTGDVSIYDRDLSAGTTQVVSTDSAGNPLTCLQGAGACHAPGDGDGIAELDISENGSRILTGQRISTDADGNAYYHLYMHVGSSPNSADLTPGAGALYDGMTADGSKVFFTTKAHLLGTDTDESADIYEAAVSAGGAVALRLVTTEGGSAVNDDSCTPPGATTWNAVSGNGKCSAVAFAGGAGVASGNGTIYFLSPELLGSAAEAEGEAGEPNVYVAKPGSDPEFVATIDTSAVKPPPAPHVHTAGSPNFRTGMERPEDIAVDQNSGDVYVAEAETGEISRWKPNGTAHNFASLTSNKIVGIELGFGEGQVAVDSSSSPLKGDFYASTNYGNAVKVFSEAGDELGEISTGAETCGVAVDQSNGDVYAGIYPSAIKRYRPKPGAAPPIDNSDYEAVEGVEINDEHCNIDASADGHVYSWTYYGGPITQLSSSAFTTAPFPSPAGTAFHEGVRVESDPSNGDVYVDKGNEIIRYNSSGAQLETFGAGVLSGGFTYGIGVNGKTGDVYASDGSSVIDFAYPPPYEPIDNPAVVHAVKRSGTHDWSDFQVSPTGQFAAFTTRLPLEEGFENLEHSEVYRYDSSSQALDCVSCPPTNALATGDASLASNGLSLADDGRVFFDTQEGIVLRDGDNTKDVYEWEKLGAGPQIGGCDAENPNLFPTGICLSLISTGTSQFDSRLLSASADGNDAFFFTHDTLTSADENGPLAKIYDARTNGGVFAIPPPALCAASDECHGPGTREAPTPPIRTISGGPGNPTAKACKKPRVKRHGKCVRKRYKRHHNRRHHR